MVLNAHTHKKNDDGKRGRERVSARGKVNQIIYAQAHLSATIIILIGTLSSLLTRILPLVELIHRLGNLFPVFFGRHSFVKTKRWVE